MREVTIKFSEREIEYALAQNDVDHKSNTISHAQWIFRREVMKQAISAVKLAGTLGFYANEKHWKTYDAAGPEDPQDLVCPIAEDCGDSARKALNDAGVPLP